MSTFSKINMPVGKVSRLVGMWESQVIDDNLSDCINHSNNPRILPKNYDDQFSNSYFNIIESKHENEKSYSPSLIGSFETIGSYNLNSNIAGLEPPSTEGSQPILAISQRIDETEQAKGTSNNENYDKNARYSVDNRNDDFILSCLPTDGQIGVTSPRMDHLSKSKLNAKVSKLLKTNLNQLNIQNVAACETEISKVDYIPQRATILRIP